MLRLGETVDVLVGGHQVEHGFRVETVRQRQLDEDAVHLGIGGERADGVFDLGLRGRRWQPGVLATSCPLRRPSCACCARRSGSAGRRRRARWRGTRDRVAEALDLGAQAGDGLVAQQVAVHEDGAARGALRFGGHHDRLRDRAVRRRCRCGARRGRRRGPASCACRRRSGRRSRRRPRRGPRGPAASSRSARPSATRRTRSTGGSWRCTPAGGRSRSSRRWPADGWRPASTRPWPRRRPWSRPSRSSSSALASDG